MTKKNIATTITSISVCSLFFSSCGTVSKYRKDPSEWDNPTQKVAKVKKTKPKKSKTIHKIEKSDKLVSEKKQKQKKGGFFGLFSKYRKDPSEWDKQNAPDCTPVASAARASSVVPTMVAPVAVDPIVAQPVITPAVNNRAPVYRAKPQPRALAPLPNMTAKKAVSNKAQRRSIPGLLTPNVDKLPDQKDLQEVLSVSPKTNSNGGVKIPIAP